ncbi:hypothetical protein GPA23_05745 [Aromatoleum aromaticum]|nr:hypothetical protein [Aromatoleum aromaticum]
MLVDRQSGSSLIEALLAAVILAFGLLAVGKFQITLADAIGTGRERVEALFLAQEEIDRLRAFDVIAVPAAPLATNFAYEEIDDEASTALPNSGYVAAYSRGTTVSANPVSLTWAGTPAVTVTPDLKLVLVNMTWTDKRGNAQALTLPSIIAMHDPADAAWLIACQSDADIRCGTKDVIKTPYNRNLRIPYPAKDLGGGKSAFAPPGSPYMRLVFSNTSGIIEKRCIDSDTDIQNDVLADYTSCTALNGYLLSGYISGGDGSDAPSVTIGGVTTISVAPTITTGSLDVCFDDSETTKIQPGFISYACIIIPTDTDGNPDTPAVWSGSIILSFAGTGVTVGTGASNVRVCRFSVDSDDDGTISNREHPATYTNASESLGNQNFIVIQGSKTCNGDHEIQHQP